MYLLNEGYFTIKDEEGNEDKFFKLLVEDEVIDSEEDARIETQSNGELNIFLDSECYGDLEDPLSCLAEDCTAAGIKLNGYITYRGDYNGVYEIIDGEFSSYDIKDYVVKKALVDDSIISPELKKNLIQEIRDALSFLPQTTDYEKVRNPLENVLTALEHTQEAEYLPISMLTLSPEECMKAWNTVVKIYKDTIDDNNPCITMTRIIQELGMCVTKEVFAVVAEIKKDDDRITPCNRKYLSNVRYNPKCVNLVGNNPMKYADLDCIHTSHFNSIITELANANVDNL